MRPMMMGKKVFEWRQTAHFPRQDFRAGSFLLEERQPSESLPGGFHRQHQLLGKDTERIRGHEILPNVEKIEHKESR